MKMPKPMKNKILDRKKPHEDKPKVRHRHEKQEKDERDCTLCEYATLAEDGVWECSAEKYYPASKICFKARKGRKE
jgi:hypothetical protein